MSIQGVTFPFPARLRTPLKVDSVLLITCLVILLGGLVILASASVSISDRTAGDAFFYLERQLLAAFVGLLLGAACLFVPMRVWQSLGPLFLLLAFVLLALVFVPGLGHTVNGSTRWIRAGFMNIQVSEPARLCLLIYLAGYLVRRNRVLRDGFSGFLRPIALLSVACMMLLAEPDFGATIVLLATAMVMLFVAGARMRDFFLFLVVGGVGLTAMAIASPYRLKRLTGFMDPWSDPFNSGFQLTQSLIAIGRGEWFGVGLGDSVQKLFYLPEAHTDFVFAVYAEEFGLLGSLLMIGVFLALLWRILRLARQAAAVERLFEAYLAVGIGTWLGLQAFINIGVNMGLLPTKGLTLPLISYGRSSLIVALASIGILMRIHHELETDSSPVNRRRRTQEAEQ